MSRDKRRLFEEMEVDDILATKTIRAILPHDWQDVMRKAR